MAALDFRNLKVDLKKHRFVTDFHDAVEFAQKSKEKEMYPTESLWGEAINTPVALPDCNLLVILGGCGTDLLRERAVAQLENGRRVLVLHPISRVCTGDGIEHEFCVFATYSSVDDIVGVVEAHIREMFVDVHHEHGQGFLFSEEVVSKKCCGRCAGRCTTNEKDGGGAHQVHVPITTQVA